MTRSASVTDATTDSTTTDSAVTVRRPYSIVTGFALRHAMIVVMMLVIVFFASQSSRFFTLTNLQGILIAAAPFALIVIGQTLVILTGGIDLSVGSIIALSGMVTALLCKEHPALVPFAVVIGLTVGLAAGAINGVLVALDLVPPFIATLAMLTAASGFAFVVGGGAPINGLPDGFGAIANTGILGLKIPVVVMIVAIVLAGVLMSSTAYGQRVYAVGGNPLAARIAGVRTRPVLFSVYAVSGTLAGVSGVFLTSRVIAGSPTLGAGYELDAIAAVVIGGASLFGGRGTIWGSAIGLLLIQTLNNGLDILLVPAYWQSVIKGALIVCAVVIDVWSGRRRH